VSTAAALLPEFDQETASTRKLLALIPEQRASWKPHPKSWCVGDLGVHLANLVGWTSLTCQATELDLDPPGGPKFEPPKYTGVPDLLAMFDRHVGRARAAIAASSDADLQVGWTLKMGGRALFTLPRIACLRSFVMNHMIHHRGQLSVYLRLLDVPLPAIYGPTADAAM